MYDSCETRSSPGPTDRGHPLSSGNRPHSEERHPCVARKGGAGCAIFAVVGMSPGWSRFEHTVVVIRGGRLPFLPVAKQPMSQIGSGGIDGVGQKRKSNSTPSSGIIKKYRKMRQHFLEGAGLDNPAEGARGASRPSILLRAAVRMLDRRGVVARSRAKAHSFAPPCLGHRPASTALCKRVRKTSVRATLLCSVMQKRAEKKPVCDSPARNL